MGVITYISGVYPGLISDKTIVQQSGLLNLLTVEDLVLVDKGFLIQDLVPDGVSVNTVYITFSNQWGIYI